MTKLFLKKVFLPYWDNMSLSLADVLAIAIIRWATWGMAALLIGLMIFNPGALTEGSKLPLAIALLASGAIGPRIALYLIDNDRP